MNNKVDQEINAGVKTNETQAVSSKQNDTVTTFIANTQFRDENLIDLIVENGQRLKLNVEELKAAALVFEDLGSFKNEDALFQVEKIWASGKEIDATKYDNIFKVTCDGQSLLIAGIINEELDCAIVMLGGIT